MHLFLEWVLNIPEIMLTLLFRLQLDSPGPLRFSTAHASLGYIFLWLHFSSVDGWVLIVSQGMGAAPGGRHTIAPAAWALADWRAGQRKPPPSPTHCPGSVMSDPPQEQLLFRTKRLPPRFCDDQAKLSLQTNTLAVTNRILVTMLQIFSFSECDALPLPSPCTCVFDQVERHIWSFSPKTGEPR